MGFLSIISFLGFTLMVALVAWFATNGTDESTADYYYLGGRSLGAVSRTNHHPFGVEYIFDF